MSNAVAHPHPDPELVTTPRVVPLWRFVLVTGLLLLFGGLIWMWVAFGARDFRDVDAQRADQRYKIYDDVRQSDQKALTSPPSVLNKEQGKIRLPLNDAISLTLRDINANKPHAAYPVQATNPAPNPAPPTAPGAPAAPAAPSPAASAAPGASTAPTPAAPAPNPAAAGTPPTTASANNTVLPKQADAPASDAANGNPSPTPTPAEGMTNPR